MSHTIKDCEQCGADYMYHDNEKQYELICQNCYQKNKELIELKKDLEENNFVVSGEELFKIFLRQIY